MRRPPPKRPAPAPSVTALVPATSSAPATPPRPMLARRGSQIDKVVDLTVVKPPEGPAWHVAPGSTGAEGSAWRVAPGTTPGGTVTVEYIGRLQMPAAELPALQALERQQALLLGRAS